MSTTEDAPADEEVALDASPSTGLLSFYDHLRQRVVTFVERRGGKLPGRTVEALLLVPDVFMMLLRLALDRDVPRSTRTLVAGALAYFILPVDFLPEVLVGPAGYLDDLVLALAVLAEAFDRHLEPWTEKYWSGSQDLRVVIGDVLAAAKGLVGSHVYERIVRLLEKQGVTVAEAAPAPADAGAAS